MLMKTYVVVGHSSRKGNEQKNSLHEKLVVRVKRATVGVNPQFP
jgi:hypothetical protein